MAVDTLSSLEHQLAALKAATAQPIVPHNPNNFTLDDIRNMVKDMLTKEIGEVVKTLPQMPEVVVEEIITLEDALNSILTGDDQKWLLNVENVKKLPAFIMSDIGKPLTQQYINEFRSMYGN